VIGLVAIVLIVLGIFMFRGSESEEMMDNGVNDEITRGDDTATVQDDSSAEGDLMMINNGGSYEVYAPEKIAMAAQGDVVLFFHATWCPTCRALNADIESNISNIPANLTILKTDYDTYSDLKRKYGVTVQHTMVQVDSEGNLIQKWSGSPTLADLVSRVQ